MLVLELESVVGDEGMWYSKSKYDILLDEFSYVLLGYLCECFCLGLLSKVVVRDYGVFYSSRTGW